MDIVIDSGFNKGERLELIDMIKDIELVEQESDLIQVAINQALYVMEKDLAPLDVLCLYKTISLVGGLADAAQDLGDQLIISVSV